MAKRDGHAAVSVYMMAYEAPRIIDFMRDVFGGETILRYDRDDGTLMHASVRIGDSTVMVADGTAEFPSPSGCMSMSTMRMRFIAGLWNTARSASRSRKISPTAIAAAA